MVCGLIKEIEVLDFDKYTSEFPEDEKNLIPIYKDKFEKANDRNEYIVRFKVFDDRFPNKLSIAKAFVPKSIIENNLIELNTYVNFCSTGVQIDIAGVETGFLNRCN